MTSSPTKVNVKAVTESSTFRRTTTVKISIKASPEIIWALLTNAADFPRWNTTVKRIGGEIALYQKIRLTSKLDESRTFTLKVTEFEPAERMVWKSGAAPFFSGIRLYTLTEHGDQTEFLMSETISGLMYPLAAKSIPDFKESFQDYALDLKREAEMISNVRN